MAGLGGFLPVGFQAGPVRSRHSRHDGHWPGAEWQVRGQVWSEADVNVGATQDLRPKAVIPLSENVGQGIEWELRGFAVRSPSNYANGLLRNTLISIDLSPRATALNRSYNDASTDPT